MSKQNEIEQLSADIIAWVTSHIVTARDQKDTVESVGLEYAELIKRIATEIEKLYAKSNAESFAKGQVSVRRRNKSGCCCTFDENDNEIMKVCGAHQEWRDGLNEEGK